MTESKDLIIQSSMEETGPVTRKVNVQISAEEVKKQLNDQYQELKRTAAIKGFRKGKAPRQLLERYYGEQVEIEVKSNLLGNVFKELIDKHEIRMVAEPQIARAEITAEKILEAEMIFEVRPVLTVKDYKGIELVREPLNVLDVAVEQRLETIRQHHATLKPVEEGREAAAGDTVEIDFEGKVGGEVFEGGQGTGQHLELGSGRMIPGFEEGIMGMKAGETKDVELTFPGTYHAEKLAGKAAVFTITLKVIKTKVLPELDDEFAKDLGGDFKTIDEVKNRIRKDIEQGEVRRLRRNERKQIIEKLLKINEIAAPPSLIEQQIQSMMQNVSFQLQMSGLDKDKAQEMLAGQEDRYRPDAETEVKAAFLFQTIAEQEEIEVTDADVEARIAKIAEDTDRNIEAVKAVYEKENAKANLKEELLEDKVLDFLIENATVTWEEPVGEGSATGKSDPDTKSEE